MSMRVAGRFAARFPIVTIVTALLGVAASPARACRCAQQPLAGYFSAADEVVIGRLVASTDLEDRRVLDFELSAAPFKGDAAKSGDVRRYYTELSTAACGVRPAPGAIYILFAQAREADASERWVDTCSGTRVHISTALAEPAGFEDVPARFVAQQLAALAGLDVLRDVAANAPAPDDPGNTQLIGLLALPALTAGASLPVFTGPSPGAAIVAEVPSLAAFATREYGYEESAAVVVTAVPGWYRLGLSSAGSYGWVRASDAGEYFDYPALPVGRLAYLNEHWSGFVWPEAGAGLPFRHAPALDDSRTEHPVNVLERTEIGGLPWFRIELLESICDVDEPRVVGGGWVPAYGRTGEPIAWFYSRGC